MADTNLHIGIVGAGLLGRLLSWRLQSVGHQVTLFERDPFDAPRSAAWTAAAMISPYSEIVQSEPLVFSLGQQSLRLWPEWIDELNRNCESPVAYSAKGSIAIAHPQDFSELQQFKQDLQGRLGADDESRWLNALELQHLEPALHQFDRALLLPDEASLDNRNLLIQLLRRSRELGTECIDKTLVEIRDKQCIANGRPFNFDFLVDCRGIGAKADLKSLRGVRGEVMWLETREVQFNRPIRLMHPRYKLYLVPKPEGRMIIGATEIESEDRSPISVQSTLELASALYTINPALAEARIVETDSNLRPAFFDNLPKIHIEGHTIRVNGLYRHGYLLAPPVVDHLVNYIKGQAPGRFWQALSETPND